MTRDDEPSVRARVAVLVAAAERLDELADTAALMGDEAGAQRWRSSAADIRECALHALDGEE